MAVMGAVDIRRGGVDTDLLVVISMLLLLLLTVMPMSEMPGQKHADADNSYGRQRYDNSCNKTVV